MKLIINGNEEHHEVEHLAELLERLEHTASSVATAVNGAFVPASQRAAHRLKEDDVVEILAPMQGG